MRCCDIPLREFKHRVAIERLTLTRDNQGGAVETWAAPDAESGSISARILPLSGSEARVADRMAPRAVYSCMIRYRADSDGAPFYTPADRLRWRGRLFDILFVSDYESEGRFMYLLLNEGALS